MNNHAMRAGVLACLLALTCVGCWGGLTWSNAKPGLWEITRRSRQSGAPLLPENSLKDTVKNLPAEEREKALARAAGGNKAISETVTRPITFRSCMTAAELMRYANPTQGVKPQGTPCQMHVVSKTSTEVVVRGTCNMGEWGTTKSESHTKLLSREAFTVTTTTVSSTGSQTHRIETEINAKWVASSCDAVKGPPGARTPQ